MAVMILKKTARMVQITLSVSDILLFTAQTSYMTHIAQANPTRYNKLLIIHQLYFETLDSIWTSILLLYTRKSNSLLNYTLVNIFSIFNPV